MGQEPKKSEEIGTTRRPESRSRRPEPTPAADQTGSTTDTTNMSIQKPSKAPPKSSITNYRCIFDAEFGRNNDDERTSECIQAVEEPKHAPSDGSESLDQGDG